MYQQLADGAAHIHSAKSRAHHQSASIFHATMRASKSTLPRRAYCSLLISEAGNVERTARGLTAYVVRMNLHLAWIMSESDCNKARLDIFI